MDGGVTDSKFGKAVAEGQGFAERIYIPFPDKLSYAYHLLGTVPISEKPSQSWVSDLLGSNEHVGGMAVRDVSWLRPETTLNIGSQIGAQFDRSVSPYAHGDAYVIGILREGKPAGLLMYKKGERPRQGVKVGISSFIKSPQVAIGVYT